MPEIVPEFIKRATERENHGVPWSDTLAQRTIARLLWERGEPEPIDPDEEVVRRILMAAFGNQFVSQGAYSAALAAYKAEKDRT
jgi:hypothetical protein